MTTRDKIAQDLAIIFDHTMGLDPVFRIAQATSESEAMHMVICIDKMGINHSRSFPVAKYASEEVEQYFEKECPVASNCKLKFYIWL